MTSYLILHKVRGQPAFDIAERLCEGEALCQPNCGMAPMCKDEPLWIIPTSGHRAFPIMYWELNYMVANIEGISVTTEAGPIEQHTEWNGWPDHYACNDKPIPKATKSAGSWLLDKLGLGTKVDRRI